MRCPEIGNCKTYCCQQVQNARTIHGAKEMKGKWCDLGPKWLFFGCWSSSQVCCCRKPGAYTPDTAGVGPQVRCWCWGSPCCWCCGSCAASAGAQACTCSPLVKVTARFKHQLQILAALPPTPHLFPVPPIVSDLLEIRCKESPENVVCRYPAPVIQTRA